MLTTIVREWSMNIGVPASLLLSIHTGEIFHLEGIYPILNGIGLIGLLVTGLSMSGLFAKKNRPNSQN
ncbi:PepSY-associated TM helix protein [Richelia sinica FACHB-800]|uniref:PepSY-associated TM helix protein n=2 Tax=Richelia TaxID=98443 RepID=A0A975Y3K6_9NOST|nr:PepSY-associated TM helix protein [Richelia sinica FACHB-800]